MKKTACNFIFIILITSGCNVGTIYKYPNAEVPCQWHNDLTLGINSDPIEETNWWESLQDPILNELMTYATAQNLDLKIAAIRVLQARSEANAKKAENYPRIDGSANYGHIYYSKDALVNGLLGTALPVECEHVKRHVNFYEIGFDVEWELDFFGLKAHEYAALKAHEEAVNENLCNIWVTLSAEIARNYIQLRGHQKRLEIIKKRTNIYEDELQLINELSVRGLINDNVYSKQKAEINLTKAEIPTIEMNIIRTIHRLSILLGRPPGELFICLEMYSSLPEAPCNLSIGVPSELLRRRPDIRKAEREVAAATEKIASAIASLYPRFSLHGFIGEISTHAGSLFSPASAVWYAGPQILVPIFNSRLLLQEVEYNKMAIREAIYTYQKTVLEALEEAENAIAALKHEKNRLIYLKDVYQQQLIELNNATELYQRGVSDQFALNKVKQSLLTSESAIIQSQEAVILNYISLFKAIGGSWK